LRDGEVPPRIPIGALKGLVRLALSLLPSEDLETYEDAIEWISNPDRMFAYAPTMPQNFPKDSLDYEEYFAGDPRERARAARDVLMDLPRIDNLPANRATRAAITGGK